MSYDEKTTEIEIPGLSQKKSNILRVDFTAPPQQPKRSVTHTSGATATVTAFPTPKSPSWDPTAPWLLRLMAVLTILLLSLLIL